MTIDEMYTFIRSWINQILNTQYSLSIPVIFSNENAARPPLPYFVIHRPPISNIQLPGENYCPWQFTNEQTDTGNVEYSTNYQASISLEEVGGDDGQTLQYLTLSRKQDDILQLWKNNKITLLSQTAIADISDITENVIEKRAVMDITVIYNVQTSYDPGYIGTVEFSGTISLN